MSDAVGVTKLGDAGHEIVVKTGKVEITGATLSITFIVCDAVAVFPEASVAVQVLVIEYEPAQAPLVLTSFDDSEAELHVSLAVGIVKLGVAGQEMVDIPGKVEITGAVVSTTVIEIVAILLQFVGFNT